MRRSSDTIGNAFGKLETANTAESTESAASTIQNAGFFVMRAVLVRVGSVGMGRRDGACTPRHGAPPPGGNRTPHRNRARLAPPGRGRLGRYLGGGGVAGAGLGRWALGTCGRTIVGSWHWMHRSILGSAISRPSNSEACGR